MKIRFLGTGGAFSRAKDNYHNNALIEIEGQSFLIDCGGTALEALSLMEGFEDKPHLIDNVLITHIHADHVGGLEELAYRNYFLENKRRPTLMVSPELLPSTLGTSLGDGTDLWENCLRGGLEHIQDENNNPIVATLDTYFEVNASTRFRIKDSYKLRMFPTKHVVQKASFGFYLTRESDLFTLMYTADSKILPINMYDRADVIFHDCSFGPKYPSSVHAHFEELIELPEEIRAKIWLMHYGSESLIPEDLHRMTAVKPRHTYEF